MTDDEEFERLLESLVADENTLLAGDLSALSDLDQAHIERFQRIWKKLTPPRRRLLLDSLGEQANQHIELQFDRVNIMAIDDPDAEVRMLGIENLWESQDQGLIRIFLKTLAGDTSVDVRATAIEALGRFVLLGQLNKISSRLLAQIEDALLGYSAGEGEPSLRRASIEALGYCSHSEVDELIRSAYSCSDEDLRQSALVAMGRSANEAWKEPILKDLEHPSPTLRSAAAKAAGELELRSAVSGLGELLDDVDDRVRLNAIWSLGQIGGIPAREALETLQESLDSMDLSAPIEEALEHMAFLEGTPDFLMNNFDEDEDELA
jgi:HEAT repeat protein